MGTLVCSCVNDVINVVQAVILFIHIGGVSYNEITHYFSFLFSVFETQYTLTCSGIAVVNDVPILIQTVQEYCSNCRSSYNIIIEFQRM
jgi:hypothetical protein